MYYSHGQNNDDVWFIPVWLLSSLVPRPRPAFHCFQYGKVTESWVEPWNEANSWVQLQKGYNWSEPPNLASTTGNNINIIHTGFMGVYNFIMLKMSHNLKWRLIHLVGEVDTGSMLDQFPDNPHIPHFGRHHETRLLRLLRSNDNSTINFRSHSSYLVHRNTAIWLDKPSPSPNSMWRAIWINLIIDYLIVVCVDHLLWQVWISIGLQQ